MLFRSTARPQVPRKAQARPCASVHAGSCVPNQRLRSRLTPRNAEPLGSRLLVRASQPQGELLWRNGHVPAIATARGAFLARGVAEELGIGLLVCCCGAHILNGTEVLSAVWLPEGALHHLHGTVSEGFIRSAALDDRCVYMDDEDKLKR